MWARLGRQFLDLERSLIPLTAKGQPVVDQLEDLGDKCYAAAKHLRDAKDGKTRGLGAGIDWKSLLKLVLQVATQLLDQPSSTSPKA